MLIAGHHFTPDWLGRAVCGCGTRWTDIAGATEADIDRPGWAHIGTLTAAEYRQIEAERERRWRLGLGQAAEVVA